MTQTPFVKSEYPRIENDNYQTVDKRCIYGFLEHFRPTGLCVDVCSPTGSGIVDTLNDTGVKAMGTGDAFKPFPPELDVDWVITNPPYKRPLVDEIVEYQISRVVNGEIYGFACLVRAYFGFAKSRKPIFESPHYKGEVKLLFRPWWSEERKASPIHQYVWHVWTPSPLTPPRIYLSSGEKPY